MYGQKTILFQWSQNNDIFLEIMIFTDLWAKTIFILKLSPKLYFSKCWTICKTALFFSKCWYFWTYGQKQFFSKRYKEKYLFFLRILIFSDTWAIFSKLSLNNVPFLEMSIFSDIHTNIGKIRLFQRDLNITYFFSKCWYFGFIDKKLFFFNDLKITIFFSK